MALSPRIPFTLLTSSVRALALREHSLRSPAAPVDFDELSRDMRARLVEGLVGALYADRPGVGLAAPMAGLGLRIVVMVTEDRAIAMANPRIEATASTTAVMEEGNLCLPGVRADVRRPTAVTVTWRDPSTGRERTESFSGWQARILQHEIEILDGRMFIDQAEGPPRGTVAKPEDRAARAAAELFGEDVPRPTPAEPLAVATFDRDVAGLSSCTVRRAAADVDLARTEPALLRRLAQGLLRTQFACAGVGLAAPQVGLQLRMAAIDDQERPPLLLVNPQVLDRSDDEIGEPEGCLTIPGWRGEVMRPVTVKVRNHSIGGDTEDLAFSGHLARIVQHEIDHLDGVLFIDRMAPETPLVAVGGPARAEQALRNISKDDGRTARTTHGDSSTGRRGSRAKSRRKR